MPRSRRPLADRIALPPGLVADVAPVTNWSCVCAVALVATPSASLACYFPRTQAVAPNPQPPELRPPPRAPLRRAPPSLPRLTCSSGCGRAWATSWLFPRVQPLSVAQVRRVAAAVLVVADETPVRADVALSLAANGRANHPLEPLTCGSPSLIRLV